MSLIDGRLDFVEFFVEQLGALGFGQSTCSCRASALIRLVLPVGVGQDLLADDLEEADQKAAGTAGRVADNVAFLGIDHVHHEFHNGARGEELADFAPEGPAQEPFKGDAFDVFAGIGKVVAFQQSDDFSPVAGFRFSCSSASKMLSA